MLRTRSFITLLVAEVISGIGSNMTWLAMPWFVLVTTGSEAKMGLVVAAELLPMAVLGIPSGAVAARLGARRTMVIADAARAPVMLSIPLLHLAGLLAFPLLLALAFLLGVFIAPYFASQRVVVPEIVGEDEADVGRANAVLQAATRTANFAGPAIAGVLIALTGELTVLFVDAATFAVAAVLLGWALPRGGEVEPEEAGDVLIGARTLWRDGFLRGVTLGLVGFEAAFQALIVALPAIALARFGDDARIPGLWFSAYGAGALIGTVAAYRVLGRVRPLRLAIVGIAGGALPVWVLTAVDASPVWAAMMLLVGLSGALANAPLMAAMTLRVPPGRRAQVVAAGITIVMLGGPVAITAVGPALELWGPRPALVAIATAVTVSSLVLVRTLLRGDAEARGVSADQPASSASEVDVVSDPSIVGSTTERSSGSAGSTLVT